MFLPLLTFYYHGHDLGLLEKGLNWPFLSSVKISFIISLDNALIGKKIHGRKKKQKNKISFDLISNLDDEGDLAELGIFS